MQVFGVPWWYAFCGFMKRSLSQRCRSRMYSLVAIDTTIAPAFATPYQSPINPVQMIKGVTSKHDTTIAIIFVRHGSGAASRRFHSNTVVELLILWHMSDLVNQPAMFAVLRPSVTS
jgi:hypothetical protein